LFGGAWYCRSQHGGLSTRIIIIEGWWFNPWALYYVVLVSLETTIVSFYPGVYVSEPSGNPKKILGGSSNIETGTPDKISTVRHG